jgi:hypothetical protein
MRIFAVRKPKVENVVKFSIVLLRYIRYPNNFSDNTTLQALKPY